MKNDINLDKFKESLENLNVEEKSILLHRAINQLDSMSKIEILLDNGATPRIMYKNTPLWKIAFSLDIHRASNSLVLPKLIPHIFMNFDEQFIEKSNLLIENAMVDYRALNNRSNIAHNNLKNSDKIQANIEQELFSLVEKLALNIHEVDSEFPAKTEKTEITPPQKKKSHLTLVK